MVGEVLTFVVLLRFTATWDPKLSFSMPAALIAFFAVLLFFWVREYRPKLVESEDDFHQEELSFCQKVAYLSRRMYTMCTSDAKYVYCILSAMVYITIPLLITIYFLVWITTFLDSGYFASEAECKIV